MRLLTIRLVLLAGLVSASVSCNSLKNNSTGAGGEANPYDLADNGGYTSGGFYGDSTPSTYNASSYASGSLPAEGAQLASYDSSAGGFVGGLDEPHVIPFTDHGSASSTPAPSYSSAYSSPPAAKPKPKPKPAAVAAKKAPAPKPAVAAKKPAPKKPAVAAAKKPAPKSKTVAASSAKKGAAVKAVYQPPGKKASTAKVRRLHTVKAGDNLTKLSSRYGVAVSALKSRNNLASDRIIVGQRLQID